MGKNRFRIAVGEYFSFTRSERNGTLLLGLLLMVSLLLNLFAGKVEFRSGSSADEARALLEQLTLPSATEWSGGKLFTFDPNTISPAQLDSLALPLQIRTNLLRYRAKGGQFRRPQDFGKLYGMNDSLMAVVLPYLDLPGTPPSRGHQTFPGTYARKSGTPGSGGSARALPVPGEAPDLRRSEAMIELNLADSALLETLPGIGPAFAGRIIRYRRILGGFRSPGQLREVYGMTEERYRQFEGKVTVDSTLTTPLRLNFADSRSLARHPYIGSDLARAILHLRSAHGPFQSPSQLLEYQLLDTLTYRKLVPYLTCR